MESVIPGLHATAPAPLPFGRALQIRAFLARRERGNLLVYGFPELEAEAAEIERLGGVARHYLGHGHEAGLLDGPVAPRFLHAADRSLAGELADSATFDGRHLVDDDFEVIPIPGHTPGSTAFLWDSGAHRILFTADTIMLRGGEWVAAVLASSDRDAYLQSLELIAGLDFDVLVPWVSSAGGPWFARTGRDDARTRIEALYERVRGQGSRE